MKIAVVGATGMIGNHCVRAALARGHDVRVVHRATSDLRHLQGLSVERATADVSDVEALRQALTGVDAVIHSAGYYPPPVPADWRDERDRARTQMERFFSACDWSQLRKVVFIGSVVALPRNPDATKPATEDLTFDGEPDTNVPYLHVKYELDRLARERGQRGDPVVVAIPGMCFGEYDKGPTTGQLIVAVANRKLPAFVHGLRNVVYTGDAARGMILACEQGRPGSRYLFTGTNIALRDLVPRIAAVAGVKPPRLGVPASLARVLAAGLEAKHRAFGGTPPLLNSTTIAVSAGQFLDGRRTEAELGWKPEVALDEAIERALTWFRDNGYLQTRS